MNGMRRNLVIGLAGITLAFASACYNPFLKDLPQVDGKPGRDPGGDPLIKNTVSINSAAITVTAPAKGDTPDATATVDGAGYTCGTVTWTSADNPFLGNTKYTATVTLTAEENYVFAESFTATINGFDAEVESQTEEEATISLEFDATLDKIVSGISIKTQPVNLTYTHGDTFDPVGLAVRLTYDDGTHDDFELDEFGTTISIHPAHKEVLRYSASYNNRPVTVKFGELPEEETDENLTVNKAAGAPVSAAPTAASQTTSSITVNEVAITANTGQTVEYSRSDADSDTSNGAWQDSRTFDTGLSAGTTYYFFARSKGNDNYHAGAASAGTAITTQQSGSFNITFEQFTDISEPSYIIHSPNSVTFTLSGTYDTGSIAWYYNGSPIGTGDTLTVNSATDDHFNKRGVYYITVEAKMNGILYSKRIELVITAP